MLPKVIFEVLSGAVNGVNTSFTTANLYIVGSVVVFINGRSRIASMDDGWTEAGGTAVTLKQPPQVGDIVQAYYRPRPF